MGDIRNKVVIVGGGAAGFFVAANLDKEKNEILLLEKAQRPMQKIKIAGGGRCNVTHACFDPRELVGFYPRGHKELLSVFTKFQPGDTMAWFEDRGLPLKIEDDNRVFPVTDSSESVMKVLMDAALKNGVKIKYQESVNEITRIEKGWRIQSKSGIYEADKVVFCTGGSPKAYDVLRRLDIEIKDLMPSLFTFNIKDPLIKDLMGTSFEHATVRIPELKADESGALLITHWGLSGPAVLKLSAWQARALFRLDYKFMVEVNFLGLQQEQASEIFLKMKAEHPKKSIGQARIFEVTKRFWHNLLEVLNIDLHKQLAQITNREKQDIITHLCSAMLQVTGKSTFKEEFVTSGGVDLGQVDFKTMHIKKAEGLYVAGEVLDIDAITGGFNFQACWSEGWLIAQDLNK